MHENEVPMQQSYHRYYRYYSKFISNIVNDDNAHTHMLSIMFQDSGIGLSADNLKNIFQEGEYLFSFEIL
jgi:hypothetical protein